MEGTEVMRVLHIGFNDHVLTVQSDKDPVYKDDITGPDLDRVLVGAARKKELDFFEAKRVWVKRAIDAARRMTGKPPITVRWVDVNRATMWSRTSGRALSRDKSDSLENR